MPRIQALKYGDVTEWLKRQPDKKDLRLALRKLRGLIQNAKEKRNDLTWWHDVGTCVNQFVPKGNQRYGENVIEMLVAALQPGSALKGWTLPNLFYRARSFADKYPSRKDAESLGRKRNADNKPLTQLHVSALLSVKDDAQRQAFLEQCLAESWSGAELRRRIQNAMGRKRGMGGRALRPPKYSRPRVALWDIKVLADRWTAFHKAWFGGQHSPLRSIRAQDRNEDTLREIEKAKAGLQAVREDLEEALRRFRLLGRQVKSALATGSTSRTAQSRTAR